jgi:hypothetical protein
MESYRLEVGVGNIVRDDIKLIILFIVIPLGVARVK